LGAAGLNLADLDAVALDTTADCGAAGAETDKTRKPSATAILKKDIAYSGKFDQECIILETMLVRSISRLKAGWPGSPPFRPPARRAFAGDDPGHFIESPIYEKMPDISKSTRTHSWLRSVGPRCACP
jgi:hypothetical protein